MSTKKNETPEAFIARLRHACERGGLVTLTKADGLRLGRRRIDGPTALPATEVEALLVVYETGLARSLEACGVSLTGRASVASARRGSGMTARCRHARTVAHDALEVCLGCDRVRPAPDRGVVYRWRAAIGDEREAAAAARAAHPRRARGAVGVSRSDAVIIGPALRAARDAFAAAYRSLDALNTALYGDGLAPRTDADDGSAKHLRLMADRFTRGTATREEVIEACRIFEGVDSADAVLSRTEAGIASAITEVLGPDVHVDGAGCESGDPVDVLVAAVTQALALVVNQRNEMILACGEAADFMQADDAKLARLGTVLEAARQLREHGMRAAWSEAEGRHLDLVAQLDAAIQAAEDVVPPLTFDRLRVTNVRRCSTHYHPIADWSLSDWCTAVAGELGELAGVIKNLRRAETEQRNGHKIPQRGPLVDALAEEAADTIIYLDLLCARAAVDLGAAVTRKFNRVSRERLNTAILLPEKP